MDIVLSGRFQMDWLGEPRTFIGTLRNTTHGYSTVRVSSYTIGWTCKVNTILVQNCCLYRAQTTPCNDVIHLWLQIDVIILPSRGTFYLWWGFHCAVFPWITFVFAVFSVCIRENFRLAQFIILITVTQHSLQVAPVVLRCSTRLTQSPRRI